MATAAVSAAEHVGNPSLDGRIEVRAPSTDEAEQAWKLQREAFSLSEDEPCPAWGTHDVRVAVRDRRVVSCLTLLHTHLAIRGEEYSMAGVRHVATEPGERNQGYASALVRETLKQLRQQGCHSSVLFPFSFRYYRKFGYELGGNHCQFWCRPGCIPAYQERKNCRKSTVADALPLVDFHRERSGRGLCTLQRGPSRWEQLCRDPELTVLIADDGGVQGYAITRETRDAYGGRVLRVLELTAGSRNGWRALLGHLAHTQAESIEWCASAADLAASGLMRSPAPLREGFKPRGVATIRPMFQFRVVDLEGALQTLATNDGHGTYRLALKIHDDLLPENTQPLALHGTASGTELRPARASDPCLEMDIRIFSQIFCGYLSPDEAISQGLAQCSSPAAVEAAERIFQPGEPFLSELDRF